MSKGLVRAAQIFVLGTVALFFAQAACIANVQPGMVGVRYNNATGVLREDLQPGWHLEIPGLQRVWPLPSNYLFLHYAGSDRLSIRTKDNNTVGLDVSVPFRIKPGSAFRVMDAGNHLLDTTGKYRFMQLASETTVSVLREHLAELRTHDFYQTDRRLEVSRQTLRVLNAQLKPLNLEAADVLIRGMYFRDDYEQQLARIQLNEQSKLLDEAQRLVAQHRQELDNYTQQTAAQVSAREQEWLRRIAELERAYQVGVLTGGDDLAPGAVRRQLEALTPEQKTERIQQAAQAFGFEVAQVTDAHLLGIRNIEAETTEYDRRVRSNADGVAARLGAEGDAQVAQVQGAYETRVNNLLNSPGGRAYVAYQAAQNISFDRNLTFHSRDGIPAVLRLQEFATQVMGR